MDWSSIINELSYKTSRSSGAGGQHVNKTETKVEVLFDVLASSGLSEEEKLMVNTKLANRINEVGVLAVNSQKSRSQLDNKENAIEKLNHLLVKALIPVEKRIRTKPDKGAIEERLAEKKIQAEKKIRRRKPEV
jgi:ribosome-associated protein